MPFDTISFGSRRTRLFTPLMSSKIRFRTSARDVRHDDTPRSHRNREAARLLREQTERIIATLIRRAPAGLR